MYNVNLYIAFMYGDHLTETMRASAYIINNYFKPKEDNHTLLYRCILEKLREANNGSDIFGKDDHKSMVILSDGKVYNGDSPIDPNHFQLIELLKQEAKKREDINLYYVNITPRKAESDIDDLNPDDYALTDIEDETTDDLDYEYGQGDDDSENILRLICKQYKGKYYAEPNWYDLKKTIKQNRGIEFSDYRFLFEQPDNKVFVGANRQLQIDCIDNASGDSLLSGTINYSLGGLYHPVIISKSSFLQNAALGSLVAILICFLTYCILQYVLPKQLYRNFTKKYVLTYTGRLMSNDDIAVAESCYLCKAPFEEGDQIVTKCSHTMHKQCWDENEYHCPEYGRHCKNGSHYYNEQRLSDPHNAPFYMKWVITALFAALLAWLISYCVYPVTTQIFERICMHNANFEVNSPEYRGFTMAYIDRLRMMPEIGTFIALFLTAALCCYTVTLKYSRKQKALEIAVRSVLAAIMGLLSFFFACLVSIGLRLEHNDLLINLLAWELLTMGITFCATYKTRVSVKPQWLLLAALLPVGIIFLRYLVFAQPTTDLRIFNLIVYMLYCAAVAYCIAVKSPRSERFFLRVEGPIKEIYVALYKWFKTDPRGHVTIGKSVDCNLQTSWDTEGIVAPIQAEIYLDDGVPHLLAIEDGVTADGNPIDADDTIRLFHGRSFKIGRTTFTYIEKDR